MGKLTHPAMDLTCLNEWCLLQNMLFGDDCRLCLCDGRGEGCCICHLFPCMYERQHNTHPEWSSGSLTPLPHLRWNSSPDSYAACHFCS